MKFALIFPLQDDRNVVELACLAEDTGWDAVFIGDAIWTMDPLILLAGIATRTSRICLGTMVLAAPLRKPWRLASESLALDRLSKGRLILGLGMGATWMGWQCFPSEVPDTRIRAEKLDETIDILTKMYLCEPFEYQGKHYQVALTRMDQKHYPPPPVQQPRIPIWIPAVWQREKSMRRVLKCDGIFVQKMDAEGKFTDVTPADVAEVRDYVAPRRTLSTPFDIIQEGKTGDLSPSQQAETLQPWAQAGVTWWAEGLWNMTPEQQFARVAQGPPKIPA
jgi:hypothetical protein